MDNTKSDREPDPPAPRRSRGAALAAIAVVSLTVVLGTGASVALLFGWHPMPATAFGCSLHKRFHSANGPLITSDNLLVPIDCLKVTLFGREDVIRDAQKIAAVRGWLDSRPDLWAENFLHPPDQGAPLIVIRACSQKPGNTESYVYLTDDWVGFNPGKRLQRPICRGEWREMAAIVSASGANR